MTKEHELLAPEETAELENTDLKDKIAELKLSLDDSSNKNRNFLMSFLLAQIYLLVTVGGTSDLQLLLPNSVLQLPLVNFSVNMFGFYILAPVFLIAFHFNILFNLREHSRKLSTWVQYNGTRKDTLFLPAFMFNSLTSFKTGQINYSLLRAIIFFIIYFFPLALLGFIQWRFSDYQNLEIGVWHFIAFIIDLCLLTFYWDHIIKPKADDHETEYWRHLKESNFYFGIFWKLLNLSPAFLPVLLFFKFDSILRALLESRSSPFELDMMLEDNIGLQGWADWLLKAWRQWPQWPQWSKSVAIAFFIIFVFVALLNWKKLSRQGFRRNQKRLFFSIYALPLLWRKEEGNFIPPGGESKRPDLFRSPGLWKRAIRKAGELKPANIFAFLMSAAVVLNLAILILKIGNILALDENNSLFNLLTPRIDVSEQRLVEISPDKDIKKGADKKGEPAWLQAYKGLNFNGRNLWLADFGRAKLYRADFRGADLRGANFIEGQLQGAKLNKADLRGANFNRANLRGANFNGADLRGADLAGVDLREAQLYGADLRKANLSYSNLRGTGLYSSQLRGANLSHADLWGANLYFYRSGGYMYGMKTRKEVESSDLRETKLIGTRLSGTDLTGADLRGADLTKADLELTTLRQADLRGAVLTEARLRGADLAGAVLKGAKLNFAQLQGASLNNADLSGATAHFAGLQGADLSGADLRAADLNFARLQGANLTGARLRGALLSWSNFYGAAVKRLDVEANLGLTNMKRTWGIGVVYMDRDWTSLADEFSRMKYGVRKFLSTDEIRERLWRETVRGISWKSISKEISKRRTKILPAYETNDSYEAGQILQKVKQKVKGAEERLKKAESRWQNFDEKSLKKLKPGKMEDFLKFRRDYVCRSKLLAQSIIGQYYAIYRDEKIDLKKALLERMKSKCPAVFREAFPQKNRQTSGIH